MDPFASPLRHPFCNTGGLRLRHPQRCSTPQQGWTRPHRSLGIHSATRTDYASGILNGAPLRNKGGPVHIAPWASILQHGRITPHASSTALHSATRTDPFTSPLGHSATRMDYASRILNGAPLRNKGGPVHIAPWASILQHGWITPQASSTALHSATRTDPFPSPLGHPFCNTGGLRLRHPQRCSTPQQGWTRPHRSLGIHSATRMDYSSHLNGAPLRNKDGSVHIAPRTSILQYRQITLHTSATVFYSATWRDTFTSPLGHPFCNTDELHFTQCSTPHKGIRPTSPQRHSSFRPLGIHSARPMDYPSHNALLRNKDRHASHGTHRSALWASISQHTWLHLSPYTALRPTTRTDMLLLVASALIMPIGHQICNTDGFHFSTLQQE